MDNFGRASQITARSINDFFYQFLDMSKDWPEQVERRDGKLTVDSPGPVMITIMDPSKRVLSVPYRNNSLPASIAETLWVLAGRNDIEWLSYYLPRAKDFSDDGSVWRAGYGPRIRKFGPAGVDQLRFVIEELLENRTSRRAAITIMDPTHDSKSPLNTKDFPCLAGDTIVRSPEGDVTVKSLVNIIKRKGRYPVFSCNEKNSTVEVKWCTAAWKTGTKHTVTVRLDDRSNIRVTADHLFCVKRRSKDPSAPKSSKVSSVNWIWTRAIDLKPGDSLVPLTVLVWKGDYQNIVVNLRSNWSRSNRIKVSRMYAEFILGRKLTDSEDLHHINEDQADDSWKNLAIKDHGRHSQEHKSGSGNPMYNGSDVSPRIEDEITCEKMILAGKKHVKKHGKLTYGQIARRKRLLSRKMIRNYFGRFSDFRVAVEENHKIVSVIYNDRKESVYDLTVEDNHNVFVGSGVLVHNCTMALSFMPRGSYLDLVVFMRSNDAIWGLSGVNAFEFTFLQEIVAQMTKFDLGRYYHTSNSLHYYDDLQNRVQKMRSSGYRFDVYDHIDHSNRRKWQTTAYFPYTVSSFHSWLEVFFRVEEEVRHGMSVDKFFRDWNWVVSSLPNPLMDAIYAVLFSTFMIERKSSSQLFNRMSIGEPIRILNCIRDEAVKVGMAEWACRTIVRSDEFMPCMEGKFDGPLVYWIAGDYRDK